MNKKLVGPKVLFIDIETLPILGDVWKLFDNNVGIKQIRKDWSVASIAAQWMHDPGKMMYRDNRAKRDPYDDKQPVAWAWQLMDEADVIVYQNGKRFDKKKLFARMVIHRMQPPSSFKSIDTWEIAKSIFGFTSNKQEYLTEVLCPELKKDDHKKFPGHELWSECVKRNMEAWEEMEKYNKQDVRGLRGVYDRLIAWDGSINFNLYHESTENKCKCGGGYVRNGYSYTATSKFQRWRCLKCGSECRGRDNLFTDQKKDSLRVKIPR